MVSAPAQYKGTFEFQKFQNEDMQHKTFRNLVLSISPCLGFPEVNITVAKGGE
jgi:hypothetical protein